jgi:membrane protein
MTAGNCIELIRAAGVAWMEDRAPRMGAALAYYTIFSLAPLLIIAIALAGLFFGEQAARGQVAHQIQSLVGHDGAIAIEEMLKAAQVPSSSITATITGFLIFLFGAMAVFGELQDALNTIWKVPPKPSYGWLDFVRERLLSFSMILVVAFLLLVLLVVSAVLSSVIGWFETWLTVSLAHLTDFALSMFVVTGLFAMIFKLLPNAKIAWRDVWLGSTITALLFLGGRFLIGLYLGRSTLTSAYGAAGSFAVLLIWLYYSAQVFLFGAELTYQFARRFGSAQMTNPL